MAIRWQMGLMALWRRSSVIDRIAVSVVVLLAAFWTAKFSGWQPIRGPLSLVTDLLSIVLLAVVIGYLLARSRRWIDRRLLWSLRNRLIFAYVNIAVVPIVLLLAMGGIAFYMLEIETVAHLLHEAMDTHLQQMAAVSRGALSLAQITAPAGISLSSIGDSAPIQVLVKISEGRLPGLVIDFRPATAHSEPLTSPTSPAIIVEQDNRLWIEGESIGQLSDSRWVEAIARVPITPVFLSGLAAELGPITLGRPLNAPRRAGREGAPAEFLGPQATASVSSFNHILPAPQNLADFAIIGATTFEAYRSAAHGSKPEPMDLVATFAMRSSSMLRRIQGSLGEFAPFYFILLAVVGGLFIVLWLLALFTGMVLTRRITRMVSKLDEATHHVKAGDFSHRISIAHRDQLGALAESFNSMTASIEQLLEGQRQHQRLEHEVAIAREVQSQLFPRTLPAIAGLELGAICQAAREVSGDYYDALQLDERRVAMAVADISGKGISAALLMANLDAVMRSLVLSDGSAELNTAELAMRLNRHLLLNSSDDRYATLFFAVYDAGNRTLRYTNAGHLPPFFICGDHVQKLDRGGTVIGLLEDCTYEQATISVSPGSLLVAYSDGLTEPENSDGEEFGEERLIAEVLRHRNDPPTQLCQELIEAVRLWCSPAEPFDDQTVLVARMD